MLVRTTWKVWGKANCFSAENQSFGPSRPLKRAFCGTRGEGVVSRVPIFASRGATSQLKEPREMQKLAWVTPPPSPWVPQKGLFKGREGKNEWFSAAKCFFTASIFAVSATNVIGYFFILVKGFCNRLFFYFIGFGRYKAAAGGFEKGVKPF